MIKFVGFALSLATLCYLVFELIVRLANFAEKYVNDNVSFLVVPLLSLFVGFVVLKIVEKGEKQTMRNV
ncbi:hypothetical protein C7A11_26580 [Pseudomonas simiae]|nr:hypothetical protein C7A11_26580 [Pseudomonas simiae]